jgi:hypothetical protein
MSLALAAIDRCSQQEAAERLYNVYAARELIETGLSADPLGRLFQTGWCGDQAISFVTHPLILIDDAGPLVRAWASINHTSGDRS